MFLLLYSLLFEEEEKKEKPAIFICYSFLFLILGKEKPLAFSAYCCWSG